MISGPCQVCGATHYPLSMGGPSICPSCDCGLGTDPRAFRLLRERAEVAEQRNKEAADAFNAIDAWVRKAVPSAKLSSVHGLPTVQMAIRSLEQRLRDQAQALRQLMKESAAVLALAEPELRAAIGHTNVAVFKLRIEEAGALLMPLPASPEGQK